MQKKTFIINSLFVLIVASLSILAITNRLKYVKSRAPSNETNISSEEYEKLVIDLVSGEEYLLESALREASVKESILNEFDKHNLSGSYLFLGISDHHCSPCIAEQLSLLMQTARPDSRIAIVFLNHSRRDVELFKKDNNINWPTIYVSENDESPIRNVFSPFAFVADSKLDDVSYLFVSNSKVAFKSENYFNFIINNWDTIENQYEKISD